ncbi:uncharacterized protein LOC126284362 [Schistocerca gregaria]|uniref:uncharacterized protein LOC126284362 n=1 Tax=Schistocerca gregaria TaxID=7010 RepID=UPI00211E3052|nr:uncharacterized protein LOC126284362 [Schistocerca gregaria]
MEDMLEAHFQSIQSRALLLMSKLAPHNCLWQEAYSGLLDHIVLQRLLAMALYIAPESVKTQVLSLVHNTYFPEKSLSTLSRSLFDLEPMLLQPQNAELRPTSSFRRQQDMIFLFTPAQEQHLNDIVSRLEEALKNGQIANVEAADAVDIYQWKLAALRSSERMLCASMETAGDHITKIQQKLARATARAKQNKKLLSSAQQELQSLHAECANTNKKLNEAQSQRHSLEHELTKEKQCKEELIEAMRNKDHDLQSAELHIGALLQKLDLVCTQLDQREAELKSSQDNLHAVNNDFVTLSKQLEEKSKENDILQKQNEQLCAKNSNSLSLVSRPSDVLMDTKSLAPEVHTAGAGLYWGSNWGQNFALYRVINLCI